MFESLVESYKSMSEIDKKNSLIYEVKNIIAILQNICDEKSITYRKIKSKEILDLNKGKESTDDYLEALFIYIMYLEELVGSYVEKTLE